jgi:hypothetical protein
MREAFAAFEKRPHGLSVSIILLQMAQLLRKNKIRIFGAGYWWKGKKIYERENQIHG